MFLTIVYMCMFACRCLPSDVCVRGRETGAEGESEREKERDREQKYLLRVWIHRWKLCTLV